MYLVRALTVALALSAPMAATAAEATFTRTLTVNGQPNLVVATGAGNIRITSGADNQVHIFGKVTSSNFWGGGDAADHVRRIADNPPIEQSGNIIRIGKQHGETLHNISISYEIQAPANTLIEASSGSGNINVSGVGQSAKLSTGSGSIDANGLRSDFNLETGSGNIHAELSGTGDGKAETGSGSITLRGVQGGLHATTGSGSLDISGKPLANWKLETGSGSITLDTWKAGYYLDASTGSGSISTDVTLSGGNTTHNHVQGKVNGGGPTLSAETGSGSIHIR